MYVFIYIYIYIHIYIYIYIYLASMAKYKIGFVIDNQLAVFGIGTKPV